MRNRKSKTHASEVRAPWLSYGLAALVAAMIVAPVTAWAAHDFGDVPDTNVFHDDIAWMLDNGITSGCGSGNYCPSNNVTREQMAAFMKRLSVNKVVDAATAVSATDANTVDGLDATAFYQYDSTVPAGTTIYGYVGTGFTPTAADQNAQETISFPVPMPAELRAEIIRPTDPNPAGCPGSPDAPSADPGFLCIYVDHERGASSFGFYKADGIWDISSVYGGQIWVFSSADGSTEFGATWAATPPDAGAAAAVAPAGSGVGSRP